MNRTVLVTAIFFDEAANAFLKSHNCKVVLPGLGPGVPDTTLSKERMFELLRDADAWIVGTAPVTREMLTSFPQLLVLAKRGVGYDQVDVAAAKELGRVVTIAPGGNGPSVADHTIALMLAVARRISEFRERMRSGNWSVQPVTELYRKTVGLVGLGRIGRAVAQRLKGFEATILAFDVIPDQSYAAANGVRLVDLPFLLRESDYISLHLPLTPASRNLIDQAALACMKETAILVNTARGGLIDEAALLQALRAGKIGGAALDVFLGEQDAAWRSVADELMSLPNVVVTPHVAGASREGLARGNMLAAQAIVAVFDGGTPAAACLVADGRLRAE
ncbi:MAG: phosphoglycerate dehydrogenase [Acidipila sp.]|nr:phosphoglycerate dehydrogenase [Acidipila sp.]